MAAGCSYILEALLCPDLLEKEGFFVVINLIVYIKTA